MMKAFEILLSRAFLVVLAVGLWACGEAAPESNVRQEAPPSAAETQSAETHGAETQTGIEVLDPRVQLMPGMGAAYLTLVNHGGTDDRLVRVESPISAQIESHESLEEDGVMRMVPHPEGFALPAGETITLEPGGKHLMLLDLQESAVVGEEIALTLYFEQADPIEVTVLPTGFGEGVDHGAHSDHIGASGHGASGHEESSDHDAHSDSAGASHEGHKASQSGHDDAAHAHHP